MCSHWKMFLGLIWNIKSCKLYWTTSQWNLCKIPEFWGNADLHWCSSITSQYLGTSFQHYMYFCQFLPLSSIFSHFLLEETGRNTFFPVSSILPGSFRTLQGSCFKFFRGPAYMMEVWSTEHLDTFLLKSAKNETVPPKKTKSNKGGGVCGDLNNVNLGQILDFTSYLIDFVAVVYLLCICLRSKNTFLKIL